MDRVSESLLTEFSNERGLSRLPEDRRFEHFVSFITIGRHHNETFDTSEVVTSTTTGIDAVAVIVNGILVTDVDGLSEVEDAPDLDVTFVFIQADRGSSFDVAKLRNFGDSVSEFFEEKSQISRNRDVKDVAEVMTEVYKLSQKFKRGNPACRLYYATTGTWTGDALLEKKRKRIIKDLKDTNLFRDVTCVPLGAGEIQKYYREAKNAIEREFIFANRVTIPDVPRVTQAYLGFLPVRELIRIITDEHDQIVDSLFHSNPRDWQGYNQVNKEIKETLTSEDRSRFVLMNNGITIIARKIRPTGDKFVIEDFQIVNGCQTSHLLHELVRTKDMPVSVPVRLIGTEDESVINSIIRATNRQTQVSEDQFYALQEFPKQLEQFFQAYPVQHRIYYERRSKQYERQGFEKTRIVTQSNVIGAFSAMFLEEPHRTTRNYSSLKAKVGKKIFVPGQRMEPYYTAAFALYKLEYYFRNGKLEPKYKPARFHILLAMRLLGNPVRPPRFMNSREIEEYCKPIRTALWNSERCDKLIRQAAEAVEDAVEGSFDRDDIRTEKTTKKVMERCKTGSA